jgi:hypothetical protein
MRIFASEVLVVYRAPEISRTMNSLPLEFMDLIHAGNLLRHDGQKIFNDAARDMLTNTGGNPKSIEPKLALLC